MPPGLPASMSTSLPDDILHLITHELWLAGDFDTLYKCALSSRRLALPAVAALYRMHETAPVTYRGREELARSSLAELAETTRRWAGLWRSLILSGIGRTAFPYCHYARALDLGDLAQLFEDSQFSGSLVKAFMKDVRPALAASSIPSSGNIYPPSTKEDVWNFRSWNYRAPVEQLGDVVVRHSPLVEELTGNLQSDVLASWIPLLPKLRRIQLWRGAALENQGPTIREACPNFSVAEFYHWSEKGGDDADTPLADFLDQLKPQSLRSLQFVGRAQIGSKTLTTLSEKHGSSLAELILADLPPEAISELGLLRDCTALRSLTLSEDFPRTNLQRTHLAVFGEVIAWLSGCSNLKRLKLTKFMAGAAILTPLFTEPAALKLEELELSYYAKESGPAFYKALAGQAESMRELLLQSATEEDSLRIDVLVEGVCKLRQLRTLHLKTISDFFNDDHIINIARSLSSLEELWVSGWGVTDAIFPALSDLYSLRRADLFAFSDFTFEGIVGYISQLGPGNKELLLGISMANVDLSLSEDEQALIRNMIQEKVNGRFDYTLARDPEGEDSSDSDSD